MKHFLLLLALMGSLCAQAQGLSLIPAPVQVEEGVGIKTGQRLS